ncbi:MAG: CHAD domain-containing protein [Bryobacterales bacterium]|nr:CHAD domain-containing protein [Bryobacterales bacterium]
MITFDQHARELLRKATTRLDREIERTIADPAEDPVHDMRVAVRRLSQALRMFAALFPAREARAMRLALKPALAAAAVARDLDVGMELLRKEQLPAEHGLLVRMTAERRRAGLALTGQLYLLRADDLPLIWMPRYDVLRSSPEDAALLARTELPPLAADFFKAGRKTILKAESATRLHEFRLTAKRFRYTLELFRDFFGPVYQGRMDSVREIQSLLGKRQDYAVLAARLAPFAPIDDALQAALTESETRGLRCEDEFRRYWVERFDAPGEELKWQRYLTRRPPASKVPSC